MTRPGRLAFAVLIVSLVSPITTLATPKLTPHRISLANGRSFELNLPEGYSISVAAQGLKRVRFMAQSPDNRIFVTDMYNLADNRRGTVYIRLMLPTYADLFSLRCMDRRRSVYSAVTVW